MYKALDQIDVGAYLLITPYVNKIFVISLVKFANTTYLLLCSRSQFIKFNSSNDIAIKINYYCVSLLSLK